MNKKIINIIFVLIVLAFSAVAVSAYPVTFRITGNVGNFHTDVYRCWDQDCNSMAASPLSTDFGNPNSYTITGSGTQYFGEFDYKDCYLPQGYTVKTRDTDGAGPWDYNINLRKGTDCTSNINSVAKSPSGTPQVGVQQTFTVNVHSAFEDNGVPPNTIPAPIIPRYSSDIKVELFVNSVLIDDEDVDIFMGDDDTVQLRWTPSSKGNYNIEIRTSVPDCSCANYNTRHWYASYTVANRAPVAEDVSESTNEDVPVVVDLDCSDADGDSLTYHIVTGPSDGGLSGSGSSRTYSPDADFNGPDTFTYRCHDGEQYGNTATATITVNPVNDAPVAYDVNESTNEDVPVVVDLNCSDVDGDSLSYNIVSGPSDGGLSGSGSSRTYTPDADFNGQDTFTYRCNDGTVNSNTATVTITVNPINDAPVAEDVNESTNEDVPVVVNLDCTDVDGDSLSYYVVSGSGPSNGSLSGSGSSRTYTPDADFNGVDTFNYRCNDGTVNSNTATVTISVSSVNDAPVAYDINVTTIENTPLSFDLNCTDLEGDALTYIKLTNASHGTAFVSGKNVLYVPSASYSGNDSFTYKCNDGQNDSNVATVSITVKDVVCYVNSDCGTQVTETYCENGIEDLLFVTNVTTPHCVAPGTASSYCSNESVIVNDTCNHICSDDEGCDYTECSDGLNNDFDVFIDFPLDPGCDNYTDDNETDDFVACVTDLDCGTPFNDTYCDNLTFVDNLTTPTCNNPGTVSSYCSNESVANNTNCNYICDGLLGCDYTECSDSEDNDNDTFIDFPLDPACDNYTDDNETGEVTCHVDTDCGTPFNDTYCDNLTFVDNLTTPTCKNPGTETSYCSNESVVNNTNCSYICSGTLGCDYTECSDGEDNDNDTFIDFPLDPGCDNYTDDNETDNFTCYTDLDCGSPFTDNYCDGSDDYVTNVTTPTCMHPGNANSYCFNFSNVTTDNCSYICDDLEGCDYTECSDGGDNDSDTFIDYPQDPGCDNYTDDNETDPPAACNTDLDCGTPFTDTYCDVLDDHVTNITTPTCMHPGNVNSYCFNFSNVTTDNCTNICDDVEGCDYTECSDTTDNDNDTFIDFPNDPGCDNYTDDNETNGNITCYTDLDCGTPFTDTYCDNLTFVSNVTVPHCLNPGTFSSSCKNYSVTVNDTCNFICDDLIGCDYTECSDGTDNDNDTFVDYPNDPGCDNYIDDNETDENITCTTDLDCGTPFNDTYCDNLTFVDNLTTPTCQNAGTAASYCSNESVVNNTNCSYICSGTLGCDYTECSDGEDNDNDTFIDYPLDPACDNYTDDNETGDIE